MAPPVAGLSGGDELAVLPTATIFLDADEWDARAQALGGTSNTLLAGLSARIAQRVGRVDADGWVSVAIPVNERTADDTRANAVAVADITVDPSPVTSDLREIRSATKEALIRHRELPDVRQDLLPLVPLLPTRLTKRMTRVATGGATNVVVSSNIGAAPAVVFRADGTDADHGAVISRYPTLTKAAIEQIGGVLVLHSARANNRVFVSVLGDQPGRPNSNAELRRHAVGALSDFALTPTAGWERTR